MLWLYRPHAVAQRLPRSKTEGERERQAGRPPILRLYTLMKLFYTDWTCFTLKQIRAALFPGASLRNLMVPCRSLSAKSSHSGRQDEGWGAGGGIEADRGWSENDAVSRIWREGRRKLWHVSRMKVNDTEDHQDYANSAGRKRTSGRSAEEGGGGRAEPSKITQTG